MSLGLIYQAGGQHQEAVEVFERAVHVQRIGGGLYDLNQVPMLEKLIESNVARGSWEDASKNHQYLYWLHKRNFGDDDPRMLPVIDKLSNWHLNAYALDTSSGLFQHLISAHALFSMAVSIIDTNFGDNDIRLVNALRGLTISNYYLATFNTSATASSFESSFSNNNERKLEKVKLEQYIINSYNSGKKAIHRMMDVYSQNPEASASAAVSAKIELADWNLLFGRWHSAIEIYKQAYNELAQSPETMHFTEEFFGQPKALPDLPFIKGNIDSINSDMSYVMVNFDVSEHGRARNITIVESHPEENVRIRSRVRSSLKAAKFRPRFADGQPIMTAGLTHRYVFPN
jgi:tetratricopeptide (TPR) repeat protein